MSVAGCAMTATMPSSRSPYASRASSSGVVSMSWAPPRPRRGRSARASSLRTRSGATQTSSDRAPASRARPISRAPSTSSRPRSRRSCVSRSASAARYRGLCLLLTIAPSVIAQPALAASSMAARSSRVSSGDQSAPKTRNVGISSRVTVEPGWAAAYSAWQASTSVARALPGPLAIAVDVDVMRPPAHPGRRAVR